MAHPSSSTPSCITGGGTPDLDSARDGEQRNSPPPGQDNPLHHNRNNTASRDPGEDQRGEERVQCRSANVQKSRENQGLFLESNRDADILFVQEPFWGYVKMVASTTHKEGEEYIHTVAHRNFICLGYTDKTRVLTYIHKRWQGASPQVRLASIKHDDVLCVTMRMEQGRELSLLNVYNDSRTFEAVTHLLDRAEALPHISIMAGDFNLRDPMWDARQRTPGVEQRHGTQRDQLKELAQEQLGLTLINDPDGPPTWISNNLGVREGVLDLVWADPALSIPDGIQVDDQSRHRSDHAILKWEVTLPKAPPPPPERQKRIQGGRCIRQSV